MNTRQTKQVATKRRRRRTRRLQHTEVILNGRRLWLTRTQARLLSALLSRKGHIVSDADPLLLLPKAKRDGKKLYKRIWRLGLMIDPSGLKILRFWRYGFMLREQGPDEQESH